MTAFDQEMRAMLATGAPLLDNVTDPDVIGAYGIEGPGACDCPHGPAGHTEDQCAPTVGAHR